MGHVNRFRRLVLVGAIIGIVAVYGATPPVYIAGGRGWTNPQYGGGHQTLVPVADVRTLSARWAMVLMVTGLLVVAGGGRHRGQNATAESAAAGSTDPETWKRAVNTQL